MRLSGMALGKFFTKSERTVDMSTFASECEEMMSVHPTSDVINQIGISE